MTVCVCFGRESLVLYPLSTAALVSELIMFDNVISRLGTYSTLNFECQFVKHERTRCINAGLSRARVKPTYKVWKHIVQHIPRSNPLTLRGYLSKLLTLFGLFSLNINNYNKYVIRNNIIRSVDHLLTMSGFIESWTLWYNENEEGKTRAFSEKTGPLHLKLIDSGCLGKTWKWRTRNYCFLVTALTGNYPCGLKFFYLYLLFFLRKYGKFK